MSINYQVFTDVANVTLAAATVGGVQRIELIARRRTLQALGDGELYEQELPGAYRLTGRIVTADLAAAAELDAAAGTLAFTWQAGGGGADKSVTLTDVRVVGVTLTGGHGGPSQAEIHLAVAPDGVTNPLTIA